jgi:hypothetical protein
VDLVEFKFFAEFRWTSSIKIIEQATGSIIILSGSQVHSSSE